MITELTTPTNGRAQRVIIISIMKAGTHLLQELMVALGYGIYGQTRITDDIRPVLDTETRWRLAALVLDPDEVTELKGCAEATFIERTDQVWSALAWSWQIKFGMPLLNRYGREMINTELIEQAHRRTAGSNFSDTPANVCWLFTEFDVGKIDGHFLKEWTETGEPRIIFNYRDPRDVVLSMVNFLSGSTKRGFGDFSEFQIFNRILTAKPTLEDKLTYALMDPCFPGYDAYADALWLLNHPNIRKVTFEELVGEKGGGSRDAQLRAVAGVLDFLGIDRPVDDVASRLFNRDAFSFFKGQIGGWREAFTAEHASLFMKRCGDLLPHYGYE